MKYVHEFLAGAKALFDAIASVPGPEVKLFIGAAVSVLTGFGILHVANASTEVDQVFAVVTILLAAGVAIEKALNGAANYRASFSVTKPASK